MWIYSYYAHVGGGRADPHVRTCLPDTRDNGNALDIVRKYLLEVFPVEGAPLYRELEERVVTSSKALRGGESAAEIQENGDVNGPKSEAIP
jgi:hypothetical protein